MKRTIILITLLALGLACSAAARQREVLNINRNWQFFAASATSSDGAQVVNLPHTWNRDALAGIGDYKRGAFNYLKKIDIPAAWRGKRVFLKCYGAGTTCRLLVNGRHAGEHRSPCTAFAFEITDFIQPGGRNDIWLIVDNSARLDVMPTAGDQNFYGGIFRDVELIVTDREMIALTDNGSDGVYVKQKNVTARKVEAEAEVKVSGAGDSNVAVHLAVTTPAGDTVAVRSAKVKLAGRVTSTATIPFTIDNPRLWNGTADPYMYDVNVQVMSGDRAGDMVKVRTGFRTVGAEPSGAFYLNGAKYPVRGVIVTQDRAGAGPAISADDVREDMAIIREMGANAVRVKGFVHHPEFYRLCDREGILVWSDFPLMGAAYLTDIDFVDTKPLRDNGTMQAAIIIRQQYNHPSVVMWGVFSDLVTRGDDPTDYVATLELAAKREDPSRLTVASSKGDGKINFITDLIVWNHHFGWREGYPSDIDVWRKQLHANWKDLRSGVSYEAGASIRQQSDSLQRPVFGGNWHPERWQTHVHEEYFRYLSLDSLFWGVFAGNMFDYGAARDTSGEGAGVNDHGLVTFDRHHRKDAFFLYKANWNTDDKFVHIAEKRWNVRRTPKQQIRAYTNCPEAELFVNGSSQGTAVPENGIATWRDITLQQGGNVIEVRSGDLTDNVTIEIRKPSTVEFY